MSGVHEFNSKFRVLKEAHVKNEALKKENPVLNDNTVKGETTTSQVEDVRAILEQVQQDNMSNAQDNGRVVNNTLDIEGKGDVNPLDLKYANNAKYDNGDVDIYEFISYMTEGKGLNDDELTELIINFVQEILMDPKYGNASISAVTELIGIINTKLSSDKSLDLVMLVQTTIQTLLHQGEPIGNNDATFGDIKKIINKMIEEIIAKRPPVDEPDNPNVNPNNPNVNPGNPNVNPDPDPDPDPVVIDTPEKAMEALMAKMYEIINHNISADKIEEYLSQFASEASQYIQLQYGFNESFSGFLALFLANATQEAMKSGESLTYNKVEAKFVELMQDLGNLLPTSNTLMSYIKTSKYEEVRITRIDIVNSENGYQFRANKYISQENNVTCNPDGSMNQGMLLKFMLDYLRENVYGGSLNESQIQLLYSEIFKAIGGKSNRLDLNTNSDKYDANANGTYFDDFFAKMMEVASQYQIINIDEIKDEDVNLDALFGTKTSIKASDINSKENSYLLSNDPTIRLIMGELINASNKYNITPNADSLDFYNVFIRMINDLCGVENTNPPTLSKETLQNYLKEHSIQDLKNLINSTELRNAYYESTFKINGEIEGFYQEDSGDCWLLSGIMALNSSPEGKEIIKNAINYNPETGEYSVTFYGGYELDSFGYAHWCQHETTYTFTKEELFDLMGTGMYSKLYQSSDGTCDWDLFLFEVALSKLRKEQGGTVMSITAQNAPYTGNVGDPWIYSGSQAELISYLTGIDLNINLADPFSTLNSGQYQNFRKELHQLANDLMAQGLIDEDGTIHNYAFYFSSAGHAYAITRITADRIYFIDPGDSTKEYYIKWSDFEGNSSGLVTVNYYDSKTGKLVKDSNGKAKTITIAESGYVGPLDECPAMN